MKPKHTPTPWKVSSAGHQCNPIISGKDDVRVIAQTEAANAKRIVACVNACEGVADPSVVPEMLALLENIQRAIDDGRVELLPHWQEIAPLIAKAKGAL